MSQSFDKGSKICLFLLVVFAVVFVVVTVVDQRQQAEVVERLAVRTDALMHQVQQLQEHVAAQDGAELDITITDIRRLEQE